MLVNADGAAVGTRDEFTVHRASTLRNLAFSYHLPDDGRLLMTRRTRSKLTCPGVRRPGAFELGAELVDHLPGLAPHLAPANTNAARHV